MDNARHHMDIVTDDTAPPRVDLRADAPPAESVPDTNVGDDQISAALEDRLRRLADLHTDGHLDAQEFATAKRLILAATGLPQSTAPPVAGGVRRRGSLRPWVALLISVVMGFVLACVSAAVTWLQRPAGWALCSDGRFVDGNVVEHSVGATGYNFRAQCVADDGATRTVSSVQLLGVLWLEYTIALLAMFATVLVVIRAVRHVRRGPAMPPPSRFA